MAQASTSNDAPRRIQDADLNNGIGQLISFFAAMFSVVSEVNRANKPESFGTEGVGALVDEESMRHYAFLLAECSPHQELSAHAVWVNRCVPASLKGALAQLSREPTLLEMATCKFFLSMSEEIMNHTNPIDVDDEDSFAEEAEEEDDFAEEAEEDNDEDLMGSDFSDGILIDGDDYYSRYPDRAPTQEWDLDSPVID